MSARRMGFAGGGGGGEGAVGLAEDAEEEDVGGRELIDDDEDPSAKNCSPVRSSTARMRPVARRRRVRSNKGLEHEEAIP